MTQEDRDLLLQISHDTLEAKGSLDVLFKAIEGNGQPGIKQRLTQVEV